MAKRRARLSDKDPLSSTDQVLAGLEQFSKAEVQPSDTLTRQESRQSTSQPVEKSALRKATFQIDAEVLKKLENIHLQLQLKLGKGNAPYKEVIVEEAICRVLQQIDENPDEVMAALHQRQGMRK